MPNLFGAQVQKPDRSLIAYAFLAQATRGDGDLISGLTPIFKPIARMHAGEPFKCSEFSTLVADLYGLRVHPWAVEDIAPRLEKAGMLVRVQHSNDIHEYVYAEIPEEFDAVTEEDIREVIHQFIEFSKPILSQNNLVVDEAALEDAFLAQLIDMNFVSILLKPDRSNEDGRSANRLSVKKPAEQTAWEQSNDARAKVEVLCAAFIVHAYHNNPDLYAMLMQIVSGALVSEVVLNLQDPGETGSLNGLTVILDTPFLMSALNLSSEEAHSFAAEICNQLREQGAQLAAFSHSIDELKDNLKAVIGNVRVGMGFGPTARRLNNTTFAAYAAGVLANPELRLKQEQVRIIRPPTSQDFFQFFSEEDQQKLMASFGFFANRLAQERDAESIASTIRLRRGKRHKMGRFSSAGYVFVTENPWIAERAQQFLKRRNLFSDGEVPPTLSERYLAGLLWVIFGGKGRDLPRHLLLANCAAALEPRNDVVKQMHRFLNEIDPAQAEFFRNLMTEERAGQYTMQLTLGDSSLLNRENVLGVLDQVKNSLVEKLEAEKKSELDTIKADHLDEMDRNRAITEALRNELVDSRASNLEIQEALKKINKRADELAAKVDSEKAIRIDDRRKLAERCVREASSVETVVHVLIAATVATVGGLIAWFGIENSEKFVFQLLGAVVVWSLTFFGFWKIPDYALGGHMRKLRDSVYRRKLREYGVETDIDSFDVDWKNLRVKIRAEEDLQ